MMITPTLGRAMSKGFVKGLSMGIADTHPGFTEMKGAATSYLEETKRGHMKVGRVWKIMEPQWEAFYE